MEIDLTQLDTEGVRVREAYGPDELAGGGLADRYEPVGANLSVWLRSDGGCVRATGDLDAVIRAECDRCLKPVEVAVDARFDQRYVWGAQPEPVDDEAEVDASELDVDRLEGPTFDMRALAREQLELAAPIRVVCSDACKGLCPTCGADLNATDCGCDATPTDPRWDALKSLRKQ
jgi:DUF177 domain-containing protein